MGMDKYGCFMQMYVFAGQAAHFFWTCNMYIFSLYCLLLHLFASLCPHTVFWCSSILNKSFHWYILLFLLSDNENEYEKVIETRPIKTT